MDNMFWAHQADALREKITDHGVDFTKSSTLEQIAGVGGDEFAKQSDNTKQAIIAVMRQDGTEATIKVFAPNPEADNDRYAKMRLSHDEFVKIGHGVD